MSTNIAKQSKGVSQKLIGYRVRAAREQSGMTQDALAVKLGFKDRQSVSDIENGKRSLKPEELLLISEELSQTLEYFVDPFAVAGEAKFSWRADDAVLESDLDSFEARAGQWIGLLRWLMVRFGDSRSPLKYTLRLSKQSSYEDAIASAEDLADKLNLGVIPAERLIESVEKVLDIQVLHVDIALGKEGKTISGASCHLHDFGIILVNRNESEGRRYFDLAHELFHALSWDIMEPEHRESNSYEARGHNKRIEQLANNFAAALLMPRTALEHHIDPGRLEEVGHLADVASTLRVSPMTLAYRLHNLGLINDTVRAQLCKESQSTGRRGAPKRFSHDFVKALHTAIDKGHLSARKASKAMGMNLSQFAELFAEYSLAVPFTS